MLSFGHLFIHLRKTGNVDDWFQAIVFGNRSVYTQVNWYLSKLIQVLVNLHLFRVSVIGPLFSLAYMNFMFLLQYTFCRFLISLEDLKVSK